MIDINFFKAFFAHTDTDKPGEIKASTSPADVDEPIRTWIPFVDQGITVHVTKHTENGVTIFKQEITGINVDSTFNAVVSNLKLVPFTDENGAKTLINTNKEISTILFPGNISVKEWKVVVTNGQLEETKNDVTSQETDLICDVVEWSDGTVTRYGWTPYPRSDG